MPLKHYFSAALLLCIFSIFSVPGFAQAADSTATAVRDTVPPGFMQRIRQFQAEKRVEAKSDIVKNQIALQQHDAFINLRRAIESAKLYLKKGIDTNAVAAEIAATNTYFRIVRDGVFVDTGTAQTQRNLSVSHSILHELYNTMALRQHELANTVRDLLLFRNTIDSLSGDTALLEFPEDSAATVKYLQRIRALAIEIVPTDSIIDQAAINVQQLQIRLDPLVYELKSSLEDIERYRTDVSRKALAREFSNIWGPVNYTRPFREIIAFSIAKEKLALYFYARDNALRILALVLLILFSWIFLRSLRQQVVKEGFFDNTYKTQLVLRYPLLSAMLIVTSIFQFIFLSPPFIISFILWFTAAISLAVIFRGYISSYWMGFWIIIVTFFVLSALDNFILQASRTERFIMLGLSLAGIIYSTFTLTGRHKRDLKERGILYFIVFMLGMETISLLFNISGRFNLAKTFMVSGFTGVLIAILFLWTIRLVNEGLELANKAYRHSDTKFLSLNFNRVGTKVPMLFYILLVIGWFILVGRNFYGFRLIAEPFNNFLSRDMTLGEYTFTINNLLIFVAILLCSMILSRFVSFFAAEPGPMQQPGTGTGKLALGSWLLIIRIFIICLGLFLAFAATGIPIDRITIILGALGVGVGLGLQSLVSNLVSGLIIAFEKPVNVGDVIEINGKLATMQSIGFRSSTVSSIDGSQVIMPNGELLNHSLVNWTKGKNTRRLNLTVGVAYGTDLTLAKNIITDIITGDSRILKYPAPLVVAKSFGAYSIDFEMYFWVNTTTISGFVVISDIITGIDAAFRVAGITIPFPQQEIKLKPDEGQQIPPEH